MMRCLPGAIILTRRLGQSFAHDRVKPRTACFDAQYAAISGIPRSEAPLPILTMDPAGRLRFVPGIRPGCCLCSCWLMRRIASVPMFHVPVVLTAMMRSNSSSDGCLPSAGQMPAQLTSPSRRPGMELIKLLQASRFVMSHPPV